MSCSKLKVPAAPSTEYTDGIAFTFHFSRGTNLSLIAVDVKNGVPHLRFAPAQNVPTLTEEDIAVIVQLCKDGKRPNFFYEGFHLFHPFHGSGRLFKGYRPRYLRGTSIGETLAEADFAMKCLHVGVRSDNEKKRFYSWSKTSNLTGLRTREDFDEDYPGATIIMKCDSVDVNEEADELYFVGQPKMRIDCVRKGFNSEYSKYITGIFDNVAYHDEPLFLKVKEIVKLVLAVEWLNKKLLEIGTNFSSAWVNEHLNKPKKRTSELIEVVVPPNEAKRLMSDAISTETEQQHKQLATTESSSVKVDLSNKEVLQNGFQVDASVAVGSRTQELTIRGTFNDYDYLYEGLNPNQPTGFDSDTMEPLIPNVKSWNEFHRETVPCPSTALYSPADGLIGPPVTGGVTTQNFTTNHVKGNHTARTKTEVTVPAGKPVRMKYTDTPKPGATVAPNTDVGVTTARSEVRGALRDAGLRNGAGYRDAGGLSISSENGQLLAQRKQLETRISPSKKPLPSVFNCPHELRELRRDGKEGVTIREHMLLLPERIKGENPLAAACARACKT